MADTDPPRQAGTGPNTSAPDAVNNEARRLALNLIREELRETSRRQALLNLVRRAAQWIGRRLNPGRSTPQDFAAQYAPAASPSGPDYGGPQQWQGQGWGQERSMQPFQPGPGAYGPGPGTGGFAQGPPAQQFGQQFGQQPGQQFGQPGPPAPGQEMADAWKRALDVAVKAHVAELLKGEYKKAADSGRLPRAQAMVTPEMSEASDHLPGNERDRLRATLLGQSQGAAPGAPEAADRSTRPATPSEPAPAPERTASLSTGERQQAPPAPAQEQRAGVSPVSYPPIPRSGTSSEPQPRTEPSSLSAAEHNALDESFYGRADPSRFERPAQPLAATYTGTNQRMSDAQTAESVRQSQRDQQRSALETPTVSPNTANPVNPAASRSASPLPQSPISAEGHRVLATTTPAAPTHAANSSATPPPKTAQVAANTAAKGRSVR
ncbi:hypothetical protein ACWGJ2_01485 [Streptomyces sp. NPDC054796]